MIFIKPYIAATTIATYAFAATTIAEELAGWEKLGMAGTFLVAVIVLWKRGQAQDDKLERMHNDQLNAQRDMGEKMHGMVLTAAQASEAHADALINMARSIDGLAETLSKRRCMAEDKPNRP